MTRLPTDDEGISRLRDETLLERLRELEAQTRELKTRARRSQMARNVALTFLLAVLTSGIFYVARLFESSVDRAAMLRIGSEAVAATASIKKEGAAATTDVAQPEAADAAAVAIGSELDSFVRLFGAEEEFRELSAAAEDWGAFVASRNTRGDFILAMATLRALGLVEFSDDDFNSARLTERGRELALALRQELDAGSFVPERRPLAVPGVERTELTVGNEGIENSLGETAENWYIFTIRDPGSYVIGTRRVGTELVDTVIRLFDAQSEEEVGYDDDSGEGTYSMLREYLGQGDYILGVTSYSGGAGDYRVSVADDATALARQRGDRERLLGSALELRPNGGAQTGDFEEQRDVWYRLHIADAGTYSIGTAATEQEASVDTIVRLYRDDGETVIGVDDDSGEGYYSALREDLVEGTYYVRVSSFWRVGGSFRIMASRL
ncbi:MAG: hypothetical protein OXH52_02120 [Gammaproteobacteria bacterium]|nr:hypothetical protein [Gammaproteobacteria bacterium]